MRCRGFTLVELMVTIAIVAILAAIAFPNFEGTMRSNRVATTTNELIASISLARSEALRSPGGAVICTSIDGTACNGTSWNDGWIIWNDLNRDEEIDGEERIVRYVQGRSKMSISASDDASRITFDHRGRADQARSIAVQPISCSGSSDLHRTINLSLAGQVTSVRGQCQ